MIAVVLAALALAPPAYPAPQGTKDDPIFQVEKSDAQMNAAIANTRATLADFYRRLASPHDGDCDFMVKFDIVPGDDVEYVWAAQLDRSHTPMTGVLINQPAYTNDREGDRVAIAESEIIDWGYRAGRTMQGSFTTRVLLERLPPDEAARHREALGWKPQPPRPLQGD